jgi:LPS export ABC transporter protein LptC
MQILKSEPENNLLNSYYHKIVLKSAIIPLFGMLALFSCKKNSIQEVNILTRADTMAMQSVWNLETVYTDSGKVKIRISAPLVQRFEADEDEDKKTLFPKGMKVTFYGPDGKVKSWLSSKYAIYHESNNLWEASDSVVAVNEEGKTLNTELLFWDEKKQTIYSDKFVKITTDKEVIYGDGFEADQSFTYWEITNVKGTIYHETE